MCPVSEACRDFFNNESDRLLVFSANSTGNFLLTRAVPVTRDSELGGIYFLKLSSTKITRDNIQDTVTAIDLPPKSSGPLETMMLVAREVYFPLLTNSRNQVHRRPRQRLPALCTDGMAPAPPARRVVTRSRKAST